MPWLFVAMLSLLLVMKDVGLKLRRTSVAQVLVKHSGEARPHGLPKRKKAHPFAMIAILQTLKMHYICSVDELRCFVPFSLNVR